MHATLTLTDGMAFTAEVDGHTLTVDAAPEHGGADAGPRPKPLLLASLAGCTAMDVLSILRKMRQPVTGFSVRAEGQSSEGGHPHTIVDIVVHYTVEGAVNPERLWRAIDLSMGTYCGVSAMVKDHTTVEPRVVLNGEPIERPAKA